MTDSFLTTRSGLDDIAGRAAQRGLAVARITIGAMFLWVFFENYGKGLYTPSGYANLIQVYVDRGRAPAIWKTVMTSAAAHASIAAPMQAVAEISFGVLLTLGLLTRAVAFVAALFLGSLWVSEWGTAWIWELLVPVCTSLGVALGSAGRYLGIDAALARRRPHSWLW